MKVSESNLINQLAAEQLKPKNDKSGNSGQTGETDGQGMSFNDLLDINMSSAEEVAVAYNNPGLIMDNAVVQRLMQETEEIGSSVHDLVRGLLERQGLTVEQLEQMKDGKVTVDEIAAEEAEKLIGPDGPLSPEAVSDRIVNFSIAAFGGDTGKIDIIRGAIDRGFDEAEQMLGGLQEISTETYELIQQKLDDWVNGNENTTETKTEINTEES